MGLLVGCASVPRISIEMSRRPPNWYAKPEEFLDDILNIQEDYIYGTGQATKDNAAQAEILSKTRALSQVARQISVDVRTEIQDRFSQLGASGDNPIISEFTQEDNKLSAIAKLAGARIIKQGVSRNGRVYYALAIYFPKRAPELESVSYGLGPLWRSVVVPGWGQYYKRHKTKAWLIFASEVALVPTAFYLESRGNKERQEASLNYRWPAIQDYHNNRADQFHNVSRAAWLAAAGIYVYNLLDAGLTTGTKRYYKPAGYSSLWFKVSPRQFTLVFLF